MSATADDTTDKTAVLRALATSLVDQAATIGVEPGTLVRELGSLTPDDVVLSLLAEQPEHERLVGEYVAGLVSPERIERGTAKLAEHRALLDDLERAYAIDRHVLLAIWGVETTYGAGTGNRDVIRSLATLAAFDLRRRDFWRAELIAALRIVERGDAGAIGLLGSWAGAMGQTQFMPTTYAAHAVDFDRDGRRDIWRSIPDSLASTAAYLKASGYRSGEPWGVEVVLPAGFDHSLASEVHARRLADWQALGLARPAGQAWPRLSGDLQLLLPAGHRGPALLVGASYQAILRYNASNAYAIAVGHLADRLAGGAPFTAPWPKEERGLTKTERAELQQRLSALGHDAGTPDGIVGARTRGAIREFQRAEGLSADGYASLELLAAVRSKAPL